MSRDPKTERLKTTVPIGKTDKLGPVVSPPKTPDKKPYAPNNVAETPEEPGNLLIVDDDNTLLKFFKIHLNKFYPKIIVVDSAKIALQKIKENKIELVISDYKMPRVDGLTLLQKIKKNHPTIPTLMVTGAFLTSEETEQINKISDGMLRKPFAVEDLHTFIENGMLLHRLLSELQRLVPKKKDFLAIIKGDKDVSKIVKGKVVTEVQTLLDQMPKKVG